tara:strand:- start:259 stop:414 length:156 start_codon:yes stop_codon:yes gene_type:complete
MDDILINWELLTKFPLAIIVLIFIYLSSKNTSKLIERLMDLIEKIYDKKSK